MNSKFVIIVLVFLNFNVRIFAQNSQNNKTDLATFDLSEIDLTEKKVVEINGKWGFVWNQLLDPESKLDEIQSDTVFYENFPFYWTDLSYQGKLLPYKGYGTFFVKIISPQKKHLQLELDQFMTAYRCYLNGNLIAKNGIVGDEKTHKPQFVQRIADLDLHEGENILMIHVSNYNHMVSGAFGVLKIGNAEAVFYNRSMKMGFDFFLIGSLLIMALYHLGLFWLRRKDKSALFFGLYALIISIRTFTTGTDLMAHIFPNLSWEIAYKFDYLSFYLGVPLFAMFLHSVFPNLINTLFVKVYQIIGALFSLLVIVTPASIYSHSVTAYQILTLILILYVTIRLFSGLLKKQQGVTIVFVGTLFFVLAVINDILYVHSLIHTIELAPFGLFIFIFSQSYLLSKKFSLAYTQNEQLTEELDYKNKNLEKIVEERTQEISQQNEEIKAQSEILEHANAELEKLSIVASETNNGVIIMDKHGDFEWVNGGYTKIYGGSVKEVLDKKSNLFELSRVTELRENLEHCVANQMHCNYESMNTNARGEKIWTQTTITPIFDDNGELKKLIAIDSDISVLKQAEEEIKQRNEEIIAQKDELEFQNSEIEKQNKHIKDSILYAKTIQQAILPIKKSMDFWFDSFTIFKPKDIVSGDFYWFTAIVDEKNKTSRVFLAVVDCTGHGVPGAFMSMIGSRLLNEIVNEKEIFDLDIILEELDKNIKKALKQDQNTNNDGMDVALVRIDNPLDNDAILNFCGAKRPLYCIENNQLSETRGTRRSIGGVISKRVELSFENNRFDFTPNKLFIMGSDGYSDQNNLERKRFGTAALKEELLKINNNDLEEQKEHLENTLKTYSKGTDQRDDITLMAFKKKQ